MAATQSTTQVKFLFGKATAEDSANGNEGTIIFDDENQSIYVFGKTFYCKDADNAKSLWDVEDDLVEVASWTGGGQAKVTIDE